MFHASRSTLLATLLVCAGTASIGVALPPPLPPVPQVDQPLEASTARVKFEVTEHNFGDIFDDNEQLTEFRFINTGPEPLIIGEVKSSCGCTVPDIEKRIYEPGERGSIKVIFNPHGKRGSDARTVTVNTNDALSPSVRLVVKSFVRPLIIIEPTVLQFGQIDKGETRQKEFLIAGRTPDFKATIATTNLPNVYDVKVMETEVRSIGDEKEQLRATRIVVTLKDNATVGQHRGEMTIRTTDERRPIERTQVLSQVLGDLATVPPRLSLGRVEADAPFTREFRIQSRSGEPFKIKDVVINDAQNQMSFEFAPEDPKNPTVWRIVATGTARADQRRIIGTILVRTEVKGEETIEVRFNGFVNPR